MRQTVVVVLLAFLCVSTMAGILNLRRSDNPNEIVMKTIFTGFRWADPEVQVSLNDLDTGVHGRAYSQLKALYPNALNANVTGCRYALYGTIRLYTFTVQDEDGNTQDLQTSVEGDSKVATEATDTDADEGFDPINIYSAYDNSDISYSLARTIQKSWKIIQGNPLIAASRKPSQGKYIYRFYFKNVEGFFEYDETKSNGDSEGSKTHGDSKGIKTNGDSKGIKTHGDSKGIKTHGDKTDGASKGSKTDGVSHSSRNINFENPSTSQDTPPSKDTSTSNPPSSDVNKTNIDDLKNLPVYNKVIEELTKTLGNFEDSWLLDSNYTKDKDNYKINLSVDFNPFLLKQIYSVDYYGSINKTSLLKLDEQIYDSYGKSYQNWKEIKNFDSYQAFRQANQFVLYYWTWMRFYKVVAAYSCLYKTGRNVRIVYGGIDNYLDPENQINIVIFIDQKGKYYLQRFDYHATSLGSFGRNNWVSLFVSTPNVTQAQYYQKIVKFFKSIYPKFWSENQMQSIKNKNGLNIIKFYNPTNLDESNAVVDIKDTGFKVLNKFNWSKLNDTTPLADRLVSFVNAKYNGSKIMFVQHQSDSAGVHFQVSYLNNKDEYSAAYLLYIPADDAFEEDTKYHTQIPSYGASVDSAPTLIDVEKTLLEKLTKTQRECTAIIGYYSLSPFAFQVVAIINQQRWVFTLVWIDGSWEIQSKKPAPEGYFVSRGYPSQQASENTVFIKRLHPEIFRHGKHRFVLIENKNVGLNCFNRIILRIGNKAYEGVVQTISGVKNSQVLVSFKPILYCADSNDYGYGNDYSYKYGADDSFASSKDTKSDTSVPHKTVVAVDDSSKDSKVVALKDIHCTEWKGSTCLSCARDYFVNDDGVCCKIDSQCVRWDAKGQCNQCTSGFTAEPFTGQCIVDFIRGFKP